MPVVPIAAAAAAVAVVGGTIMSIKNQKKMFKQQKKAMQFERQKQELQSMRQKLEVIRASRTARARVQQAAENQGVATSSVAQGGQASITSQGLANLSFLDQYGFLSDQAGKSLEKAMHYQSQASMWSGIAEVGAQVYQMAGGIPMGGGSRGGGGGSHVGPSPPTISSFSMESIFGDL
jgi:hypothetical protein